MQNTQKNPTTGTVGFQSANDRNRTGPLEPWNPGTLEPAVGFLLIQNYLTYHVENIQKLRFLGHSVGGHNFKGPEDRSAKDHAPVESRAGGSRVLSYILAVQTRRMNHFEIHWIHSDVFDGDLIGFLYQMIKFEPRSLQQELSPPLNMRVTSCEQVQLQRQNHFFRAWHVFLRSQCRCTALKRCDGPVQAA